MALEADIKSAIEDNLPATVGSVVMGRLQQLESLEKKLKDAEYQRGHWERLCNEKDSRLTELESRAKSVFDLDVQKNRQQEKEVALLVREGILKDKEEFLSRLDARAEARVNDIKEVVRCVFGNNTLRTSIHERVVKFPERDDRGNINYPNSPTTFDGGSKETVQEG